MVQSNQIIERHTDGHQSKLLVRRRHGLSSPLSLQGSDSGIPLIRKCSKQRQPYMYDYTPLDPPLGDKFSSGYLDKQRTFLFFEDYDKCYS